MQAISLETLLRHEKEILNLKSEGNVYQVRNSFCLIGWVLNTQRPTYAGRIVSPRLVLSLNRARSKRRDAYETIVFNKYIISRHSERKTIHENATFTLGLSTNYEEHFYRTQCSQMQN